MVNLLIWLAAFLCPNPHHTIENHGKCNMIHISTVSANDGEPSGDVGGDTGGETAGHPPITPPPPPPPPQP